MPGKYSRRSFIKKSATIGAASIVGSSLLPDIIGASGEVSLDIASVSGKDYFKCTIEAVNMLGGMSKFVSNGAKIAILPNANCKYPATVINSDVLMAVLEMCYQVGAKEIRLIKGVADNYWDGKELSKDHADMYKKTIISNADYVVLPIKDGINLKEAYISKHLMDADVFINLGLIKHHTGTNFTGILKNLMGACPHVPTNRFFHFGSGNSEGMYENVDFLSQCIADLNILKKPDLSIGDSSEFITTNGPFGPGKIKKSETVTAGLNPVSVDSYCTRFLGISNKDVSMIGMSVKHELGEMDLEKLNIKEATV